MRSIRRKHKNYKAYLSQQLRILQVKFPFLSSKQIKAKICSSWDGFSAERKDNWGLPIDNGMTTDPPLTTKLNEIYQHKTQENLDTKFLTASLNKDIEKRVRFMDPISTMEEFPEDLTEETNDSTSDVWPNMFHDFNTIVAHKLDIEKIEPEDVDDINEEQSEWPLFGDCKTILPHTLDEESDQQDSSQEGDLMCDMFDKLKPGLKFSNKRLLKCHDPTAKGTRVTKLFKEDHEFFV